VLRDSVGVVSLSALLEGRLISASSRAEFSLKRLSYFPEPALPVRDGGGEVADRGFDLLDLGPQRDPLGLWANNQMMSENR
jgi:hypothetical protein